MITDIENLGLPAGLVTEKHDLGDGEVLLVIDHDRVSELRGLLLELGYTERKHLSVGSTDGAFYENDSGETVYVYTNSGVPFAHAVVGARLPSDDGSVGEPIYKDTVFYQGYNVPGTKGGGMTYLIRLRDGRFIVIDGGWEITPDEFFGAMEQLHPKCGELFTVAAWFITHPHDDHVDILKQLMRDESLASRLVIERFYANLPDEGRLAGVDNQVIPDNRFVREVCFPYVKAHGGEVSKPYAGMSFSVGELTFEMYYTQAEWHYVERKTINDASMVFAITREGGKRVLMTGDIMNRVAHHIMKMYTPDELHADAVQIGHHAHVGPRFNFYEAVAPKICFWPMSIIAYYNDNAEITGRNDMLRSMDAVHFIACFGDAQIVL